VGRRSSWGPVRREEVSKKAKQSVSTRLAPDDQLFHTCEREYVCVSGELVRKEKEMGADESARMLRNL
jgi:hypothetical protein